MLRKLLAVVGVSSLLIAAPLSAASAADMPVKVPAAVYDWSGTYFGGHVGGGWGQNDILDGAGTACSVTTTGCAGFAAINATSVQSVNTNGWLGGVQAGTNYQFGKLVVGAEADFSWTGINGKNTAFFGPPIFAAGTGFNRTESVNTDWTGTATTRIGIAHDRWMLYGKAGAAWAHTSYNDGYVGVGGGLANVQFFTQTPSEIRVGWTVGTGIEWAFWNNWSAKLEYDYMNFGERTFSAPVALSPGFKVGAVPISSIGATLQNYQVINEVKFGLNYKFMSNLW
jgi:outer membrane immunogenic protein